MVEYLSFVIYYYTMLYIWVFFKSHDLYHSLKYKNLNKLILVSYALNI